MREGARTESRFRRVGGREEKGQPTPNGTWRRCYETHPIILVANH